jgi:hypothetical protein
MRVQQDIKERLEKFSIMKINGQQDRESMNKMKEELTTMLATIPTVNGGGPQPTTQYVTFSHNAEQLIQPP